MPPNSVLGLSHIGIFLLRIVAVLVQRLPNFEVDAANERHRCVEAMTLRGWLFCGLWLALPACQNDLAVEVVTSDLFAEGNLLVPATLAVEIPSCNSNDRAGYERRIAGLFSDGSSAKVVGCSSGLTSQLQFSFMAEIATSSSSQDIILFRHHPALRTVEGEEYEAVGIKLAVSSTFLQRVQAAYDDSTARFSYENLSISLQFKNDADTKVLASSNYAWINGEPVTFGHDMEVAQREKVSIAFPDVYSDMVLREQQPVLLWVDRPNRE